MAGDGAASLTRAFEECFPRAPRQRCLAHRMRDLAGKVPEDVWPQLQERVRASNQAPSRETARMLRDGIVAKDGRELHSAVACFEDDFEACIAHLRFPVNHRKPIRATSAASSSEAARWWMVLVSSTRRSGSTGKR